MRARYRRIFARILKSAFLISALVLLGLPSIGACNGTISGSGGGSGWACFDQERYKLAVERSGHLDSESRGHLVSLSPLDEWEHSSRIEIQDPGDPDPWIFLDRVLSGKLKIRAPLLFHRIQQTLQAMRAGPWIRVENLPLLKDQGPIQARTGSRRCTLVQIFLRASISTEGRIPQIEIRWDEDLFNRIGPDGSGVQSWERGKLQGILLLHEALYVMASELGHSDSSQVRRLAMLLLSDSVYEKLWYSAPDELATWLGRERSYFERFTRILRASDFAGYPALYAFENVTSIQPFSPQSRQGAIARFLMAHRDELIQLHELSENSDAWNPISPSGPHSEELVLARLFSKVDDEELAFVLFATEIYGSGPLGVGENVLVPSFSRYDETRAVRMVCAEVENTLLRRRFERPSDFNAAVSNLMLQTKKYCARALR